MNYDPKGAVGKKIAELVEPGQIIGIGTGSTVSAAIDQIAKRVTDENLDLAFVPTSYQTTRQLAEQGLKVLDLAGQWKIDWGFDGADAVDVQGRVIKGKGGAMLKEKILATSCPKYIIIIDESKICDSILEHSRVPVEIVPAAESIVRKRLDRLNASEINLRMAEKKHGPVITEAGNLILDVRFDQLRDSLEDEIKQIVGVVESGLFIGYADQVYVSYDTGVKTLL